MSAGRHFYWVLDDTAVGQMDVTLGVPGIARIMGATIATSW
jgi:hypothetical protein